MTKSNHIEEYDIKHWEWPLKYGKTYANKLHRQYKHLKTHPWDSIPNTIKIKK